jgi:phage FluMu protein Com
MPRTSHITMYLYSNLMPVTEDPTDPIPNVRCGKCNKLLGRAHGQLLVLSNSHSPSIEEIPVGVPSFEVKCPNCNCVHHIIWQ